MQLISLSLLVLWVFLTQLLYFQDIQAETDCAVLYTQTVYTEGQNKWLQQALLKLKPA